MKRLLPYYRVSTKRQGQSGLGLEAQEAAVTLYAQSCGAEILPGVVEVESGKKDDRPQLARAIRLAKAMKATLVVAKLDRLARKVAFLAPLIAGGVDVYFCDIPGSDRFTIHVLAAAAEKEAKDISDRTRAALAAYKARGGLLGGQLEQCRNLDTEARQKGNESSATVRKELAKDHNAEILPVAQSLRAAGKTLQEIATHLNDQGFRTRRGNLFSHVQVLNLLK